MGLDQLQAYFQGGRPVTTKPLEEVSGQTSTYIRFTEFPGGHITGTILGQPSCLRNLPDLVLLQSPERVMRFRFSPRMAKTLQKGA